jgi:hypothetical protein
VRKNNRGSSISKQEVFQNDHIGKLVNASARENTENKRTI